MKKFFVGAYAASPCHSVWNAGMEMEYLSGLNKIENMAGLELPLPMDQAKSHWLLENLNPQWGYVITGIPSVMDRLQKSPVYGLASCDADGRKEALDFARSILSFSQQMEASLGKGVVRAVEIHSAPKLGIPGVLSSADCLGASLEEIASWNWGSIKLLLEHCDRFQRGRVAAKGFLSLEEEVEAINKSGAPFSVLVNWGRSAIEGHDPLLPQNQLQFLKGEGMLGGLIFSGCTKDDPLYGNWSDSHAPFSSTCSNSLLTPALARACLETAGDLEIIGFKMQALPKDLSISERVDLVAAWMNVLSGEKQISYSKEPQNESIL